MEWFRGGKWVVQSVETISGFEYRACLEPVPARDDLKGRLGSVWASKSFLTNRPKWIRDVGDPAGLEVYEPTPSDMWALLDEVRSIARDFEEECEDALLETCEPPGRDLLIARLVGILSDYGPLWAVTGVIDVGVGFPERGLHRSVHLDSILMSLLDFVPLFDRAEARLSGEERARLTEEMYENSKKDLREVRVAVQMTEEFEVRFQAQPLTLRAFLWEVLFGMSARTPFACRYCGDPVPVSSGPGRPAKYCSKRRYPRYRTAVYNRRQPFAGNRLRRVQS